MTTRYVTHDPAVPGCIAPDIDIPDTFGPITQVVTCGTCQYPLTVKIHTEPAAIAGEPDPES